MKSILKNILFASFTLLSLTAMGQEGELRMTISWNAAMPMGDLKNELTNNTTLRAADVSVLYGVSDRISVGLTGGWADFYEKFPRDVYQSGDGSDISAVLTNSVQLIPILATVRYNFRPEARLRPYASAGVGGNITMYKQYIGEYPSSGNKLGFAARPEVGIYFPFKPGGETGLNLGVNYTYTSYNDYGLKSLNFVGVKLGIGFPMRD